MPSNPNYLDLDALVPVEKVLKWKGQEHKLEPISLDTFVRNVKLVQELGMNPGFEKELEAIIKMLADAFPTFPEAEMRQLDLPKLNAILAFAQANDGTEAVAAQADPANPQ